jgi:hypothetical protein
LPPRYFNGPAVIHKPYVSAAVNPIYGIVFRLNGINLAVIFAHCIIKHSFEWGVALPEDDLQNLFDEV